MSKKTASKPCVKIKVTNGDLLNDLTLPALGKLLNSPNYPNMKAVKKMSDIQKSLDPILRSSKLAYIGIVKAYADLDDQGNPKTDRGQFVISPEKRSSWEKSIEAFRNTENEVELPHGRVTLDEIAKVGLTPQDLGAVAFLVE